jgi:general secretion pathway protein L
MKILERLRQVRVEELRDLTVTGWRWWVGELSAMIPDKWRELFRHDEGIVTFDVHGKDIVVARVASGATTEVLRVPKVDLASKPAGVVAETIKKSFVPGDKVVVRVPRAELLTRIVKLPITASRNLKNILKFELDRISPLDPEQVRFDYRVLNRDKAAGQIEVELRILKREVADEAVRQCRSVGLEPDSLGFIGDDPAATAQSFPLSTTASLRGQWQTWRVPALSALAVVLGIGALLASYSRQQDWMDGLSNELTAAKVKAHSVEVLQEEIDKAKLGMAFLGKQKQSPLVIKVLAEVTHILPDRTWLVTFELNGREVRIRGFSNAASSLIARFDNSPLFANSQFRSTLTKGPASDLERFDLSFEIKDGAA